MSLPPKKYETDIVIIGGGITGAGVARDCARRGLRCVLLERRDFSTGATGRNHGMLHSGARYAVTDQESARECIEENIILKKVARHCVTDMGGLFVSLPEDGLDYQGRLLEGCKQAGIETEILDPLQARQLEPVINPDLIGAVRVPDASIDPFRLTIANILDAQNHGALCLTYHEVTELLRTGDTITGVRVWNHKNGERAEIHAALVINAAGIWGMQIAAMAGVIVKMFPTRGALLILGHRLNNYLVNRCRKPSDADILVPGDTVSLIGTTSTPIEFSELDNMQVTTAEADLLIREGALLAPALLKARKLRVYAGARPLVADESDTTGRSISRRIVLLDHETRDGLKGFVTITGGKLMTYRLMAEMATDLACRKLGVTRTCDTAKVPLPGSREPVHKTLETIHALPAATRAAVVDRHGDLAMDMENPTSLERSLVCECETVSVGEVRFAINHLNVQTLTDLRRRTRIGMGTCQGELCACRGAGLLAHYKVADPTRTLELLQQFLQERWKGVRPIAWGDSLRESEFTHWLYQGVCALPVLPENHTTGDSHAP